MLIPLYFPSTCRKYYNFEGGIPLQLARKSLYIKHFRILFLKILVAGYPLYAAYVEKTKVNIILNIHHIYVYVVTNKYILTYYEGFMRVNQLK